MDKKIYRSTNFTSKETAILIRLVKKYKSAVTSKKTDADNKAIKDKAWSNISDEFNAASGETLRTANVLKNKFENLKKRSGRKFSNKKIYDSATGGGPPKDFHITPTDEEIREIAGVQMTGSESKYDDDFIEDGRIVANFITCLLIILLFLELVEDNNSSEKDVSNINQNLEMFNVEIIKIVSDDTHSIYSKEDGISCQQDSDEIEYVSNDDRFIDGVVEDSCKKGRYIQR